MRVAIDLRSLIETSGKISGVENYLVHFLNALQQRNNLEIIPFCNSRRRLSFPDNLLNKEKIIRTRIPNKILNGSMIFFNMPKFEDLYGEFDVLWMPDLRPFAIKERTRLALTVHDLSPVMHPEFYSLKRKIWHKLINYKRSFSRANVIFAVSEYTKYDLQKVFNISPNKIKVVYPGVDRQIFRTDLDSSIRHKVAKKYNLPKNFILCLSTVEPRKNILGAIAAFEMIEQNDCHLVVAGRLGWLYSRIISRIKASPKSGKIKIIGYVNETDKPYLISLARLLCYPSFYEGFGFQPLEAMACGVPVITSARTSMPEICSDAALFVEPYQLNDLVHAINALLSDQNLRAHFIEKGIKRAAMFSWQDSVRILSEHLYALV